MATQTAARPVSGKVRRMGFTVAAILALALVLGGLPEGLAFAAVGWLGDPAVEDVFPGGSLHRIHGMAYGTVAWTLGLCAAIQLRRARTRLAPAVLGLVAVLVWTVVDMISGAFDPLQLVGVSAMATVVFLHPARETSSSKPLRRRMVWMSAPIVAGGIAVAIQQLVRQVSAAPGDPHIALGHYGTTATMALVVVGAALLGSTRLTGWRFASGLAAAGAVYFGLASVIFPDNASSLGTWGGVATLLGGLVIVVAVLGESEADDPARSMALLNRTYIRLYRLLRGRWVDKATGGTPVILVTTTGRRSGRARTVVLGHLPVEDGVVVAGTNGGLSRIPDWVHNLRADPHCEVQVRADRFFARAEFLEGDRWVAHWERLSGAFPIYEKGRQLARRPIPLVLLRRA